MRASLLLAAVIALLVNPAPAAPSTPDAPAAAPANARAAADRDGLHTLVHQGRERGYLVRWPDAASPTSPPRAPLPLVLVLHGGGGHAAHAEDMTGFTPLARREGFVVVYPQGSGRLSGRLLTWNAGHCCGWAMEHQIDDVGFIARLIEQLTADPRIDARRVYVTGLSNGGMMTHRLGIELADRLAAIAPVIAPLFGDEPRPARPLPVLTINGALDRSVPPAGGPPGGRFNDAWDGTPALTYLAQTRYWARANGCADEGQTFDQPTVRRTTYACPAGLAVEALLVKDNGHAWPGGQRGSRLGDTPSDKLDATAVIWAFFKRHRR